MRYAQRASRGWEKILKRSPDVLDTNSCRQYLLADRGGSEEARAGPCLLRVKGCHLGEEQALPRGQRVKPGLPRGLLGDSEHAIYL